MNRTSKEHEYFMSACIELALEAKERGDSPVGCVIVKDGAIIAQGVEGGKTHKDITYHAEIEAIRNAGSDTDLADCTMYTTHEPCIMCSYVIRHRRIGTVVVGMNTGEIGGYTSQYPLLTATEIAKWGKPPVIITGVMTEQCEQLHCK